jgi:uncharacterized protein (TIGR02996 family)
MTTGDQLLARVCAHPDDDGPRLAYADHLAGAEPDYAEFIRLQLERSTRERSSKALSALPSPREQALLSRHGHAWARYFDRYVRESPSNPNEPGWQFDRGFIGFARMEPENFVALGDRLFAMAPIQHAELIGAERPVRPLFGAPQLRHLDSLALPGLGLDDDDAVALAECTALTRCAWLDLSDNRIGFAGVLALAESPVFRDKVRVILNGNPVDPADRGRYDWDGSLADVIPSGIGAEIEQRLGRRVRWFHPALREVADRFHAAVAER